MPETSRRAAQIAAEAFDRPSDQRGAFLEDACGDNSSLRAEVESLLAADAEAGSFLGKPAVRAERAPDHDPLVGTTIDGFAILRRIAIGGMGAVYEAEQANPHRRVALKIVRPGAATPNALKRFEHEAHVLARLQHPGIAQIFEAGAFDTGQGTQPFFAMELIDGQPLTRYAEARKLHTRQRLELFAEICDAVHYAHQKGVIHRDLKPGNVLVDADGHPKVLDFGVARVTDADVQTTTLHTQAGELLGTLPYMSPEQVLGDASGVDVRSDVYGLGVMLYELLSGKLPHDLHDKPVAEAARIIREDDVTPLSSVNRIFRGDLETIVAKALDRDPDRRYTSAAELAADARRYLNDEPITARPASALYQIRKFTRRHKAIVGGIAAVFVALVAGTAVATYGMVQANEQRRVADAARQDMAVVAEFEARMIRSMDPHAFGLDLADGLRRRIRDGLNNEKQSPAETDRLLSELDDLLALVNTTDLARNVIRDNFVIRSLESIKREFADRPLIKARLLHSIAINDYTLSDVTTAETLLEEALEIRRRLLGDEHPDTVAVWNDVANSHYWLGQIDEAKADWAEVLEISRRVLGEEHELTLSIMNGLANVYKTLGQYDEAVSLYTAALEGRRRVFGELDPRTFWPMHNLGIVHHRQYDFAEAERILTETLDLRQRTLGGEHRDTLWSMGALAELYTSQGRYDDALTLLREALEIRSRTQGMEHDDTVGMLAMLVTPYVEQGRYSEAEAIIVQVLASVRRALPTDGVEAIRAEHSLAKVHLAVGRYDDADHVLRKTLALSQDQFGDEHYRTLGLQTDLARLYGLLGRYADAESLHARTLEIRNRLHGEDHPDTASSLFGLAQLHLLQEQPAEAEPLAADAVRIVRRRLGDGHPTVGKYLAGLGESLIGMRRYPEAEAILLESFDIVQTTLGPDHDSTRRIVGDLVALYEAWAKPDRASAWRGQPPVASP